MQMFIHVLEWIFRVLNNLLNTITCWKKNLSCDSFLKPFSSPASLSSAQPCRVSPLAPTSALGSPRHRFLPPKNVTASSLFSLKSPPPPQPQGLPCSALVQSTSLKGQQGTEDTCSRSPWWARPALQAPPFRAPGGRSCSAGLKKGGQQDVQNDGKVLKLEVNVWKDL